MSTPESGDVLERIAAWARDEDTVRAVLLEGLLSVEVRRQLRETMPGANPSEHWDALMATTRVFRRAMRSVAADVGVSYPDDLDRDVCERLEELRRGGVEAG